MEVGILGFVFLVWLAYSATIAKSRVKEATERINSLVGLLSQLRHDHEVLKATVEGKLKPSPKPTAPPSET